MLSKHGFPKVILGLCSLALVGCQTVKDFSSMLVGGAKVAAKTTLGATPFVKDGVKAFDASMKELGDEAIAAQIKNLEQMKFDEVKNNRAKYSGIASDIAKYCLDRTFNGTEYQSTQQGETETPPIVNKSDVKLIVEVLSDKNAILRDIGRGYTRDQQNAFDIFRFNFLELSRITSDNDCVRIMKLLANSNQNCQSFPITYTLEEPEQQRVIIHNFADQFGCLQGYPEKLQKADLQLRYLQWRTSQLRGLMNNFSHNN